MPGSCNITRNGDINRIGSSSTQVSSSASFALGHAPSLASGHLVTDRIWRLEKNSTCCFSSVPHPPSGRERCQLHSYSCLNLDGIRANTTQLDYLKDLRVSSRPKGLVDSSRCDLAQETLAGVHINPLYSNSLTPLSFQEDSFSEPNILCASIFVSRGTGKWNYRARREG